MASQWWSAQKIITKAMGVPFREWRRCRRVFFAFVLPVLCVATLLWAIKWGFLFRNAGQTFFSPDGNPDPVLLQHALWLLGSPAFQAIVLVLMLPLLIWAQGVWFKGRLAIGFAYAGRLIGVYATACLAAVSVLILSMVIPLIALLVLPVFLFVLFYFAPALTATTQGTTWRFSKAPFGFLVWCAIDVFVVVLLLGIPSVIFEALARAQLLTPGWGNAFFALQFASFCVTSLVSVYALFLFFAVIEGVSLKAAAAQARVFS